MKQAKRNEGKLQRNERQMRGRIGTNNDEKIE